MGAQLRYMIEELQCVEAELILAEARDADRMESWAVLAARVTEAFVAINGVLEDRDEWMALLFQYREDWDLQCFNAAGHSLSLLRQLMEAIDLVRDYAEDQRDASLRKCERKREALQRVLRPQHEDRDAAKARYGGQEAWASNAAPKLDFAERRREAEDELRAINAAIEVLEDLALDTDVGGVVDGLLKTL